MRRGDFGIEKLVDGLVLERFFEVFELILIFIFGVGRYFWKE